MNKFVLLACLAVLGCSSLTSARPDVSLGYRYQQGATYGNGENNGNNVLVAPITSSYQPTASGLNYYQQNGGDQGAQTSSSYGAGQGAQTSSSYGGGQGAQASSSYGGGQVATNYIGGGQVAQNTGFAPSSNTYSNVQTGGQQATYGGGGGGYQQIDDNIGLRGIQPGPVIKYTEEDAYLNHLGKFQPPTISKYFYLHSAPEDHDEAQVIKHVTIGNPTKDYRVVFINAGSSTANKVKVIANVAPREEKTAIYVLQKKSNALDVEAEVVTPASVQHKPEVYFIKYKTPQEAEHARQIVQQNYDALGGSSQVTDEGLVQASSIVGSLGHNGASGVITGANGSVNIVGTGGVPVVDTDNSGAGSSGYVSVQQAGQGNVSPAYLPANQQ